VKTLGVSEAMQGIGHELTISRAGSSAGA
jgi:hypothetical protein